MRKSSHQSAKHIADTIKRQNGHLLPTAAQLRFAQVTAVSYAGFPVTVTLTWAGSSNPVVGQPYLASYVPKVGDTVAVLKSASDTLIIGPVAGVPHTWHAYKSSQENGAPVPSTVVFDTADDNPAGIYSTSTGLATVNHIGYYNCYAALYVTTSATADVSANFILNGNPSTGTGRVVTGLVGEGLTWADRILVTSVPSTIGVQLASLSTGTININADSSRCHFSGGLTDPAG